MSKTMNYFLFNHQHTTNTSMIFQFLETAMDADAGQIFFLEFWRNLFNNIDSLTP